ncbi:hypothetical protein WN48_01540 [Eufriesea mexicana]|nr:hypothetical protein WN48_01540 [Eufriesea mexicana]
MPLSVEDLRKLSVVELKEKLESRGLRTTGRKIELVTRLLEAMDNQQSQDTLETGENARSCNPCSGEMENFRKTMLESLTKALEAAVPRIGAAIAQSLCLTAQSPQPASPPSVSSGESVATNVSITTVADMMDHFDGTHPRCVILDYDHVDVQEIHDLALCSFTNGNDSRIRSELTRRDPPYVCEAFDFAMELAKELEDDAEWYELPKRPPYRDTRYDFNTCD